MSLARKICQLLGVSQIGAIEHAICKEVDAIKLRLSGVERAISDQNLKGSISFLRNRDLDKIAKYNPKDPE